MIVFGFYSILGLTIDFVLTWIFVFFGFEQTTKEQISIDKRLSSHQHFKYTLSSIMYTNRHIKELASIMSVAKLSLVKSVFRCNANSPRPLKLQL